MIELKHLDKSFDKRHLFSCEEAKIPSGQMIALIGASGSGKTTLMNMISFLDTTYQGEILFDGISYAKEKAKERDRKRSELFSFVFSQPYLIDYLTVEENIRFSEIINHQRISEGMMDHWVEASGISRLLNRLPGELSAGEKQRVSLVRALVNSRPFLLADEPTSHLDSENASIIISLLKAYAHVKEDNTVIVAIHDMDLLSDFDHILSIREEVLHEDK